MVLLVVDWAGIGAKVLQFILSFSILVTLHELGHYSTAKWFKCRVEKFYLFFDPWFSIVKKKIGETVYGIGWLPLGGYVKISGMVDESMDKEAMKLPPQPWEFRSKPAWQRLIIMLGGVTVNVLLAFVIYAMIMFVWGETKTINSSVKNGVWITDSLMYDIGLRNGDKIISVNDQDIEYFEEIPKKILFSGGNSVKISRNSKDSIINIPVKIIGDLVERKRSKGLLMIERIPSIVGWFDPRDSSNAKKSGLQYMDKVVKVDSVPVEFMDQIVAYTINKKKEHVNLSVLRNGAPVNLTAQVNENGRLGIPLLEDKQYDSLGVFKLKITKYGF